MASERYVRRALERVPVGVVGSRLRDKRIELGLSIRALSAMAMVSKTSIVSLEQGKACRPGTLIKIASAMGLHVERFLEEDLALEKGSARPHRHEDDRWFSLLGFGAGPVDGLDRPLSVQERENLMAEGKKALMLMFRNVPLEAGFVVGVIELDAPSEPRTHPGQEFVYVLRGDAQIRVGSEVHLLGEGECLYFDGREDHVYAPSDGSARSVSLLCFRVD